MKVTIITPCSRPENLQKIRESITFECNWIIVYDSEVMPKQFNEPNILEMSLKGGVSGNVQRNIGLKWVDEDSWVYFLDDDNLLHPDFCTWLTYLRGLKTFEDSPVKGFVFAQDLGSRIRTPEADLIKVCHVDQAQYFLHKSLIGNRVFKQVYEADGYFIEEIYNENKEKIMIYPFVMCYYNKLRM